MRRGQKHVAVKPDSKSGIIMRIGEQWLVTSSNSKQLKAMTASLHIVPCQMVTQFKEWWFSSLGSKYSSNNVLARAVEP